MAKNSQVRCDPAKIMNQGLNKLFLKENFREKTVVSVDIDFDDDDDDVVFVSLLTSTSFEFRKVGWRGVGITF